MDASYFSNASAAFTSQQTLLQALQAELASGQAVQTAGANPAAYTGAAYDASQVQQLQSEQGSQTNLQARLGIATNTLSQANVVLDQIQTIALQAINATTSGADYQALSEQVGQAAQQLVSLGNTQGTQGNYIFAGSTSGVQPFVQSASGSVSYVANEGQSRVQISPDISVNTALNGSTFMNGYSGNGYASVSASSKNTGTATVLSTGINDQSMASSFQEGSAPIAVVFAVNALGKTTYTASQSGATIGSGAVGSANTSTSIALRGMEFEISGQPASGDTFTIAPSRPQSVFALATTIQSALASAGSTPAERAQTAQMLGNALGGLTEYQQRFSSSNAKIGLVVKSSIEAATNNTQLSTTLQTNQSNLTSANIPQTLTEIEQQTAALQASYKAFSVVSGLGLFQYIS
jgi:flagellar hook-associated protein 3 FlgL